jgi:WhiB family redox-sensing transcriptional regulator
MGIDAANGGEHPPTIFDELGATPVLGAPRAIDRLILTRARCHDPRGVYTHLFHSDDSVDIARAKAICARCTVSEPCLARALERREPCGVWGGQIFHQGQIVAQRRRRGRPPIGRVDQLVVDEVTGEDSQTVSTLREERTARQRV